MGRARTLPPGFRFHPTDVELILYYLKRKVLGKRLLMDCVTELDLYKFSPWDLPDKSCLQSDDLEWFFFCPKDKKYPNGGRTNRATEIGYWKATGRDRPICNDSVIVGMKKTLIFHLKKAPRGERTNWVMHEYRLEIKDWNESGVSQDLYVLCKVFEKSGVGPKNGEQHGAPFREEEWDSDLENDSLVSPPLHIESGFPPIIPGDGENATLDIENTCQSSLCRDGNLSSEEIRPLLQDADMEPLSVTFHRENDRGPSRSGSNEMPELLNCEHNTLAPSPPSPPPPPGANAMYGGLDVLGTMTGPNGLLDFDCAVGQTCFNNGIDYIELNDLDGLLGYPVNDNSFNKYQLEVNPANVPGLEGLSIPYSSTGMVHPASNVGSSGCMVPQGSNMLAYNMDIPSNVSAPGVGIGSSEYMLPHYSGVSNHTNIENNGVLDQTPLGDGIEYLELDDFDCFMKYPVNGDGPEKDPMGTDFWNFPDWGPS